MELVVGRIARAHGVKGELVIEVRTDDPAARFAAGTVLRAARGSDNSAPVRTLTVRAARWHQGRLLVRFAEVTDHANAARWRGARLLVDVPDDVRLEEPDEFYDQQLVGLAVVTRGGEPIGEVTDVLHLPGQDVLTVRAKGAEILIPFVAAIVPEVDVAGGRLVITPPPGLLDPDQAE